jgi:hypothetical protein
LPLSSSPFMKRVPSLGLILATLLGACADDPTPITGGFREILIDGECVHGQGFSIADIDQDGDLDIVAAFSLTDAVHLYVNDGQSNFRRQFIEGPRTFVAVDVVVRDFDKNGTLDIASAALFDRATPFTSPGKIAWYQNPGSLDQSFVRSPVTDVELYGPRTLASADLTGNGFEDLVMGANEVIDANGNLRGNGLRVFENEEGVFRAPVAIDETIQNVTDLGVADIDRDGAIDIVASGANGPGLVWYRTVRTATITGFLANRIPSGPGAPYGLAISDIDGDGASAIVAAFTNTTTVSVRIFRREGGTGTSSSAETWSEQVVASGLATGGQAERPRIATGDFDGDGRTDVVLSTAVEGGLRLFLQQPEGGFSQRDIRFGFRGLNFVRAADIDRDGKLDFVTTTFEFSTRDRVSWWKNEDG